MSFNSLPMLCQGTLNTNLLNLLMEAGPGKMSGNAYDTAWVARLNNIDSALAQKALDWLRKHQLEDGSWGAESPVYHHDRAVCTLAALIALTENACEHDRALIEKGSEAFVYHLKRLSLDPAGETIAFEMIVPTLLMEASDLGILSLTTNDEIVKMARSREIKLSKTPGGMISRAVTMAFSSEMAGTDGTHILDKTNLLEENGSVGHSPSATAYYLLRVAPDDQKAIAYLRAAFSDMSVPNVYPFDIFEPAWIIWNLSLNTQISSELFAACQPHLDFIEQSWDATIGIGHASGYTPRDGDDTSFVFELLHRFGRNVNMSALSHYEKETHFQCFALESNPSISTNIHALGALRQGDLKPKNPSVRKVLDYLRQTKNAQGYWYDKWHASPYYPTSHMVIACAGYLDSEIEDSIRWILDTQKEDGSWGYYISTAEETAYCVQALVAWQRAGHFVPINCLEKASSWLSTMVDRSYPPLWIGKCLYSPIIVIKSAVLSAMLAVKDSSNYYSLLQNRTEQLAYFHNEISGD